LTLFNPLVSKLLMALAQWQTTCLIIPRSRVQVQSHPLGPKRWIKYRGKKFVPLSLSNLSR
jgi:hypothetical protein